MKKELKREKISVNQCLKKYYSRFVTAGWGRMFDGEEAKSKGFYYKRL